MADILVADDTRSLRTALSILLEEAGHTVRLAANGDEALSEYRKRRPDMLLLDIMMPKRNGYQVLAQIRRNDPLLPVVFLSARGSSADVALGLDLGSDDYIPKPFDNEVLLSRINAIFRRVGAHAPVQDAPGESGFAVGSHRVDAGRYMLVDEEGNEEPLTMRELGILRILAATPDRVVDRDRIFNEVWGHGYFGTTRTLDQYIAQLRRKLASDGDCLESVRGAGYRYSPKPHGR